MTCSVAAVGPYGNDLEANIFLSFPTLHSKYIFKPYHLKKTFGLRKSKQLFQASRIIVQFCFISTFATTKTGTIIILKTLKFSVNITYYFKVKHFEYQNKLHDAFVTDLYLFAKGAMISSSFSLSLFSKTNAASVVLRIMLPSTTSLEEEREKQLNLKHVQ
jgi:hypothetical protein